MNPKSFATSGEFVAQIGVRLRALRIRMQLDQAETAARAGISERALRQLEQGHGSTLLTFVRVLKALDATDQIEAFMPQPTVSPMAILAAGKPRARVGKPRVESRTKRL